MKADLTLYGITDSRFCGESSLPQQVEAAIQGGVTILQYREKYLTGREKEEDARAVLAVCRRYGIPMIINDDAALALQIGADGVHLGQSDMEAGAAREMLGPDMIIGVTAKTIEQAQRAQAAGADYLGSGAVFGTSTKTDAKPMDHALLDRICESVSIPVVAIGGIDAENILQLRGRKMAGFAIVSGIFARPDCRAAAQELKEKALEALGAAK